MPIYIDQDYNYNNNNLNEKSQPPTDEYEDADSLSSQGLQENKLSAGWIDKNQFAYKEFLKLKGPGFKTLRT